MAMHQFLTLPWTTRLVDWANAALRESRSPKRQAMIVSYTSSQTWNASTLFSWKPCFFLHIRRFVLMIRILGLDMWVVVFFSWYCVRAWLKSISYNRLAFCYLHNDRLRPLDLYCWIFWRSRSACLTSSLTRVGSTTLHKFPYLVLFLPWCLVPPSMFSSILPNASSTAKFVQNGHPKVPSIFRFTVLSHEIYLPEYLSVLCPSFQKPGRLNFCLSYGYESGSWISLCPTVWAATIRSKVCLLFNTIVGTH